MSAWFWAVAIASSEALAPEVRLSNVERSDDWVATEYNNQSSPSTFYTISSATSLVGASQVQWLVADHLGTPRMILDQTGTLATCSFLFGMWESVARHSECCCVSRSGEIICHSIWRGNLLFWKEFVPACYPSC
jgi:hypothetical protein